MMRTFVVPVFPACSRLFSERTTERSRYAPCVAGNGNEGSSLGPAQDRRAAAGLERGRERPGDRSALHASALKCRTDPPETLGHAISDGIVPKRSSPQRKDRALHRVPHPSAGVDAVDRRMKMTKISPADSRRITQT